jgi:hypothetical protein
VIVNFEFDEDPLVEAVVTSAEDNWKDDICERVAKNIDASDLAEHIEPSDIAEHIDMEDLFANVEIDYEELSDLIIHADNFNIEIAALIWQKFSEEFGASMKCVREELAVIHRELDARAVPIWKRWFSNANKEETYIA